MTKKLEEPMSAAETSRLCPELKEPADLGIKIGSKKEAFLTKVKTAMEEERESCEFTADLNKDILEVIERKIAVEKENFK